MKINILGNKISWFGKYSGYECISDYFPDGTLVEVTAPDENFIHKIIGKLYKSFKKWNVKSTEVYAELSFIKKMNNSLISHILYVENHLHTLSLNQLRKKILIGTIHLPFSVWRQEELNQLKYLENAIILYEEELDKFSKYVDRDKLHVIRHGVDISFFKPDKSKVIDKNKIVFIGHYLRNFEMFIEVYDLLQDMEIGKNLNFHFIIPSFARNKKIISEIQNLDNVYFHEGLSDEELLDFYQTSYVLLMPMEDSGANTAIVQALATGLPIITNDIGGIRTYGGGKIFEVVEGQNSQSMVNLFLKYYHDEDFRSQISYRQRQFAKDYLDWNLIAKQHLSIYEYILNNN